MVTGRTHRAELVDHLRKTGAIKSKPVERAFLSVRRDLFVPEYAKEHGLEEVYKDHAILTKVDSRGRPVSSSSQPAIMASMLEAIHLEPGLNVLEIGAGTGYNAALISHLIGASGTLTSLDIDPEIVKKARRALRNVAPNVRVVQGDGHKGWPSKAPFDRIIVTASTSEVPRAWTDQLKGGGYICVPLRLSAGLQWPQAVITLQLTNHGSKSDSLICGGFMSLHNGALESPNQGSVYAGAQIAGKHLSFGSVIGTSLRSMNARALSTLAQTLIAKPKVLQLDEPFVRYDFEVFLALFASPNQLVSVGRAWANRHIGIVGRLGDWIVTLPGRGKKCRVVHVFGNVREARRSWDGAIKEWEHLGRPQLEDLSVSLIPNRPSAAWRTRKVENQWLVFNWRGG